MAGHPNLPGSADDKGDAARFNYPIGGCVDGNALYISDKDNHTIRKITIDSGQNTRKEINA